MLWTDIKDSFSPNFPLAIYIITAKNIRYRRWNRGAWNLFYNTYRTIDDLAIRCTNHLRNSCCLTDVNPHFIPSLLSGTDRISKCKQLLNSYDVVDTWASHHIVTLQLQIVSHVVSMGAFVPQCFDHMALGLVEEIVKYFPCLRKVWQFLINWYSLLDFFASDANVIVSRYRSYLDDCGQELDSFNTLRPRQKGRNVPEDTLKCIFLNKNVCISIQISLKFVPKAIEDTLALFQIMDFQWWLDYRRIYATPGLKQLITTSPIPFQLCASAPLNYFRWGV